MAATISPPSDFNLASPTVYVDIYPSTQTPSKAITLTPSNSGLRNLTVEKSIRGSTNSGRFSFTITPGGAQGVNDPIAWTSILTQYSLCVIYARRGQSKGILMVGLISEISESQSWNNERVSRSIEIQGFDLTLFFTTFAYYVLSYLGFINTLPAFFGPAGTALGDLQGTPDKIGADWFIKVLLGNSLSTGPSLAPLPVLSFTTLNYQGNNHPLRDILTYWFEAYTTTAGTPIVIPVLSNFLISEGTFYDKFIQIFPFPFYEFFVNTVPSGYYPNAAKPAVSIGTQVPGFGTADVVAVARVNPLPCIDVDQHSNFFLRRERWDSLSLYSLAPSSFIESSVNYSTDDIKNFFVIAPLGPITAPGGAPAGSLAPAIEQMGFMYDQQSIAKYGFRASVENIIWWVDPFDVIFARAISATSAPVGQYPSAIQYESFIAKAASYYEPIPNMLEGDVKIPMWPEVIVGNKFEYFPFKNDIPYTFYITEVTHQYTFGGDTFTRLHIERGLPSSVYADSPSNILLQVHLGQAERVNGIISPASGIGLAYATIIDLDRFKNFPFAHALNPSTPGSANWPPSAPSTYDSNFQAATAGTACGAAGTLDWRTVKALAITESNINNSAVNTDSHGVHYYGIMQVADNAGYNNSQLQSDPNYNIIAGATILCQKLQAAGNTKDALTRYKSTFLTYTANPMVMAEVDAVLQLAANAGVTFIS